MGSRFSNPQSLFEGTNLILVLGLSLFVIVAVLGLSWYVRYSDTSIRYNSPKRLFKELCRIHQLSRQTAKMLFLFATKLKLEQPAELFLDYTLWNKANFPNEWKEKQFDWKQIQTQIFDPQDLFNLEEKIEASH